MSAEHQYLVLSESRKEEKKEEKKICLISFAASFNNDGLSYYVIFCYLQSDKWMVVTNPDQG